MKAAAAAALRHRVALLFLAILILAASPLRLRAQGVTTSSITGFVTETSGQPLAGAVVTAVHEPSQTKYSTLVRTGGAYAIPNMRVGGPYTVTVQMIGYSTKTQSDINLQLGQPSRVDFRLEVEAVRVGQVEAIAAAEQERTGAATVVTPAQVEQMPSIKRSTRDLIRIDPRNDGNFAFAGRNWLYNNISLDGSYFNNAFGLDDPAPGGQTAAEPVPFEAVEQVQVSIAPFDIREGGFTGANVNTVTKSGTNSFSASAYTFLRNESLIGNTVRGQEVIANPDLKFNQSGFTVSGPLKRDKLFFFVNAELERRDDPGSDFAANAGGAVDFGESRVSVATMDAIRQRMIQVYNYDPGPYQGYIHATDNNKVLAKIDWNINEKNSLTARYSLLDAYRDLGPHPFVLSVNNTGRGPNASSLPFQKSGYRINNQLNSIALELNSRSTGYANRLFLSYNRFRDFREPFSEDFPTIEIGEGGVTYTTVGHEPFSIHNILDQDVFQLTNNFSLLRGKHVYTAGVNYEQFNFFNSFNIFRHGVFFLPYFVRPIGSTFDSLATFFRETDPAHPIDFRGMITPASVPYKGEIIKVGQASVYLQDEFAAQTNLALTLGVRMDVPLYFTDPVDNPFSRGLTALDENDNPETVDQSDLPGAKPLFSPRFGFNWDVNGDQGTRLRGGTGIFTGRVPFVWIGNVISNPGANPNLYPTGPVKPTRKGSTLAQSFDLNAMDPDFKWPQVWISDLAVDKHLPAGFQGTLEVIYGNDINAVFMRNADLRKPVRTLHDGRPYFGGAGNNELNADGGAGIYVIDNSGDGWNLNVTAQLQKDWGRSLSTMAAYSYTDARSRLRSTEIASVLWQSQPVQGDPNNPELAWSEFGQRHRVVGAATYTKPWSDRLATRFGLFLEVAEGNRFAGAGGNRYSFIYAGDVNGDGQGGNDLIFIPETQSDIRLAPYQSGSQTISTAAQWSQLNSFIEQDNYLSKHRGEIAERFGAVNPWYSNIDLRILQDIKVQGSHSLQINLDILNVPNLLNSDWGVRKVASPEATSPLRLVRFDPDGEPVFNFTGPAFTYIDDPSIYSRWQMQIGAKYYFD